MTSSWIILIASLLIVVTTTPVECVPTEPDDASNNQNTDTDVPEEVGKLRVITITHEMIKGEYYTSSGGIHFQSEMSGDYHYLSVSTPEGQPLITAKQYHESASFMEVTENNFLVMNSHDENGHSEYRDYVVPGTYKAIVDNALKKELLSSKILRQLDDRNTNETRRMAFEALALRDEVELITAAARSLGQLGITGNENPAALSFFVLSMRLQKYRNSLLNSTSVEEKPRLTMQQKRWAWLLPALYVAVELYEQIDICVTGRRPWYGDRSNECHGMCGPGCECWSWACGDCCVHQGCVDHDTCCREHGFWSWACWSVWNFSCSSYSC